MTQSFRAPVDTHEFPSSKKWTPQRIGRPLSPWFAGNPLPMWIHDVQSLRFLELNESAEHQYGYTREEFLSLLLTEIHAPDGRLECKSASYGKNPDKTWIHIRKDGTQIFVRLRINELEFRGRQALYVVAENMTEILQAQAQLLQLAHHDGLTGLPNRILLEQRMAQVFAAARNEGHRAAIICIDLDRFKQVNDRYGHHVGDEYLKRIGTLLTRRLRGMDTVARTGGEEFTILLGEVESVAAAGIVAKALLQVFSLPLEVEGHQLMLGASMGVAVYPDHGYEGLELWKSADAAMYRAKRAGGNRHSMVAEGKTNAAADTACIESRLWTMLLERAFKLQYQPQYKMNGKIRGLEALLRLPMSPAGVLSPDRFIPIAEENGMIHPLGGWVIDEACRQLAHWNSQLASQVFMSVNISPLQLMGSNFVVEVERAISHSGINPEWLEFEITESVFLDVDNAAKRMGPLADRGVRFAIDDFGTGYSSLQHLQRLPVSALKIDRSFVQQICCSNRSYLIVKAIIALGHSLQMEIIAEGVEDEGQMQILRELNCDAMQGFLLSRPSDPTGIEALF